MDVIEKVFEYSQYLYKWGWEPAFTILDITIVNLVLPLVFPLIFILMAVVFDPRSRFLQWALIISCFVVCIVSWVVLILILGAWIWEGVLHTYAFFVSLPPL